MGPWKPSAPGTAWLLLLHGPRMAVWHFRLVLPLWVLFWEPCAPDCDSQISVPNLQRSPALRKVRFATTRSKARDPAAVPRHIHQALQLWKYLKERLWAGQCGRGRLDPPLSTRTLPQLDLEWQ